MSTPKTHVRAKRMWHDATFNFINDADIYGFAKPVFVLPATHKAYDAMVEQGAEAIYEQFRPSPVHSPIRFLALEKFAMKKSRELIAEALSALGIASPRPLKQTGKK